MFNKTIPVTFKGEGEASVMVLIQWGKDHNRSMNKFLNAIMPAISFCIQNYTRVDADGNVTVELNLGTIKIPPTGVYGGRQKRDTD